MKFNDLKYIYSRYKYYSLFLVIGYFIYRVGPVMLFNIIFVGPIQIIVGLFVGVYLFGSSIPDLNLKKKIENAPTSKINSAITGSDVEIKGRVIALQDKLLTAPVSRKECAWYSIEVQYPSGKKESSTWMTLEKYSCPKSLLIDDDSGARALVVVKNADFTFKDRPWEHHTNSRSFPNLPDPLLDSLSENSIHDKNFWETPSSFLHDDYRFLERTLQQDEMIYVLGNAGSEIRDDIKEELDWHPTDSKIRLIFEKLPKHPLIISNKNEDDFVEDLSIFGTLKLIGGLVLLIGYGTYLINAITN